MLLTADFKLAMQRVRCIIQGLCCIATRNKNWRQDVALRLQGVPHIQYCRQRFNGAVDFSRRAPRLHDGVCNHQADNLADVLHGINGKHRLVARKTCKQSLAGQILGKHHSAHAGHGFSFSAVDGQQTAVRHAGHHGRGVQRALDFSHIVHKSSCTRNLCARTFMKF